MKRTKTVVVSILLLAGFALSACTGNNESPDNADASNSEAPSAGTGVISPELPTVPNLDEAAIGIRANTTMDECTTEPGEVTARGQVTNATDAPADIVLTISWVTATSDVVARGVVTFDQVPAGEQRDWDTVAELQYDGGPVTCALNARQGTLAE